MTDAYTPDNPLMGGLCDRVFGKPAGETVDGGYRYTYTPQSFTVNFTATPEFDRVIRTLAEEYELRERIFQRLQAMAADPEFQRTLRAVRRLGQSSDLCVTLRIGKRRRTVRFRCGRWRVSA